MYFTLDGRKSRAFTALGSSPRFTQACGSTDVQSETIPLKVFSSEPPERKPVLLHEAPLCLYCATQGRRGGRFRRKHTLPHKVRARDEYMSGYKSGAEIQRKTPNPVGQYHKEAKEFLCQAGRLVRPNGQMRILVPADRKLSSPRSVMANL